MDPVPGVGSHTDPSASATGVLANQPIVAMVIEILVIFIVRTSCVRSLELVPALQVVMNHLLFISVKHLNVFVIRRAGFDSLIASFQAVL